MKKSVRVIAAAAICLAAQSSFSQTIFGSPDCGQWVAEKTPTRRAWLSGFLSGMNVMRSALKNEDPLNELSSMDQAYVWMDNYCRKYPLQTVAQAAGILFIELTLKTSPRK
jgi:hypothetical protein